MGRSGCALVGRLFGHLYGGSKQDHKLLTGVVCLWTEIGTCDLANASRNSIHLAMIYSFGVCCFCFVCVCMYVFFCDLFINLFSICAAKH